MGEGVFCVCKPGTWGEPMFAGGHSHFYHRDGQWMSGMANIGRCGPVELACGLLRETRDGPGGSSASRITATREPFHGSS